jgi:hypothetical protein
LTIFVLAAAEVPVAIIDGLNIFRGYLIRCLFLITYFNNIQKLGFIMRFASTLAITASLLLTGCWSYSNSGGVVKYHGFDEANGSSETRLDADTSTFHSIGFHVLEAKWAVDSKSAWYEGTPVSDGSGKPALIDGKSFKVITGGFYARDRNHIYFMSSVTTADPVNFRAFDKVWGYDGKDLYYQGSGTERCTLKTLSSLKRACEEHLAKVS